MGKRWEVKRKKNIPQKNRLRDMDTHRVWEEEHNKIKVKVMLVGDGIQVNSGQ